MANPVEQLSDHESYPEKPPAQPNIIVLNERRRAALAEIDNAPFSYAPSLSLARSVSPFSLKVGSTLKSVWSQVSASLLMRRFHILFPT